MVIGVTRNRIKVEIASVTFVLGISVSCSHIVYGKVQSWLGEFSVGGNSVSIPTPNPVITIKYGFKILLPAGDMVSPSGSYLHLCLAFFKFLSQKISLNLARRCSGQHLDKLNITRDFEFSDLSLKKFNHFFSRHHRPILYYQAHLTYFSPFLMGYAIDRHVKYLGVF